MSAAGICSGCGHYGSLLEDKTICISCQRSRALGFFGPSGINYELLGLQKIFLVELAANLAILRDDRCPEDEALKAGLVDILMADDGTLNGLISFLDAFQDCAADKLQFGEALVFPHLEKDGEDS